ncbi:MAG: DUF1932 domain-containing protein [Aggregatilineales bacterium]
MAIDKNTPVGILHPGAMGSFIAAMMRQSGYRVLWASEKRSDDTRARANESGLIDVVTLTALCEQCAVIVSVCPPHAAEQLAEGVIAHGFQGMYVDANAISPQKAKRIGDKMHQAGITFVDGGIIGGPTTQPKQTWLYLSGQAAPEVESLFSGGVLETEVIGDEIGKASALKMVFAANTKGTTALLSLILAGAEALGVRDELEAQWSERDPEYATQTGERVRRVTAKAWRFAGEMDEIAETFASAGLPDGFHSAAHEVYERMAHFKDAPETPDLLSVLQAIVARPDDGSHDR